MHAVFNLHYELPVYFHGNEIMSLWTTLCWLCLLVCVCVCVCGVCGVCVCVCVCVCGLDCGHGFTWSDLLVAMDVL